MDRNTARILLAIGAFIAVIAGSSILWNLGAFDALVGRNTPEAIEARLDGEMENHPAFAALYTTLEEEFPEDFVRLKQRMIEAYQERGETADAFASGERFFELFMQDNLRHFSKAPSANILAVRDGAIKVVETLAVQDVNLCARFTMDGLRRGDVPSLSAQEMIGAAARAKIQALAAGIANPQDHGEPTQQDIETYADVMRNMGMDEFYIEDFFNGAFNLSRASSQVQCDNGAIIYSAMAALPEEAAVRLGAVLLNGGQ